MDEEKENSDVAGSNSGELSKSLLNVSFLAWKSVTLGLLDVLSIHALVLHLPKLIQAFIKLVNLYIYKTSLKVSLHLKQIKAKRTVRD